MEIRDDIKNIFGDNTKDELLEVLNQIANIVDYAEEPEVILDIQEILGQERH